MRVKFKLLSLAPLKCGVNELVSITHDSRLKHCCFLIKELILQTLTQLTTKAALLAFVSLLTMYCSLQTTPDGWRAAVHKKNIVPERKYKKHPLQTTTPRTKDH